MILTQSQLALENSLRRILPADVVSCWIPDGYGGAKDVIGSNHGTCFGTHPNVPVLPSLINPSVGWRFKADDYISLPASSIPAGNEISISFWAYVDVVKNSTLLRFEDVNGRVISIHLFYKAPEGIYWDCGVDTVTYDRILKENPDALGGWHFWGFTKNVATGYMKIFLDAEEWHSEGGKTRPITTPSSAGHLGADLIPSVFFDGDVALFSIARKDWPQAQFKNFYNATKGMFAPRG